MYDDPKLTIHHKPSRPSHRLVFDDIVIGTAFKEADAERLSHRWNCHHELVAALDDALAAVCCINPPDIELSNRIREALAKAKEPTPNPKD